MSKIILDETPLVVVRATCNDGLWIFVKFPDGTLIMNSGN